MRSSSLCAVSFLLAASIFETATGALCGYDEGLSGIGQVYELSELGKLSILGFTASVTYVEDPSGKACRKTVSSSLCSRRLLCAHILLFVASPFSFGPYCESCFCK